MGNGHQKDLFFADDNASPAKESEKARRSKHWIIGLALWPVRLAQDAYIAAKTSYMRDTPARNWGTSFIIVGLVLFVCYAVVKKSGCLIWAELLGILSASLLTCGLFTVLLGFQEFIEFASRIISRIMKDNDYLKKLTPEEKSTIRFLIERSEYGDAVVDDSKGPYEFLTETYKSIYQMPYRREFVETYKLKNFCIRTGTTEDPAFFPCSSCAGGLEERHWCMECETSYELHFKHLTGTPATFPDAPQPGLIPIPLGASHTYYASQVRNHFRSCSPQGEESPCLYRPIVKASITGHSKEYGLVKLIFQSGSRTLTNAEAKKRGGPYREGQVIEAMTFNPDASTADVDISKLMLNSYFEIDLAIDPLHEPRTEVYSSTNLWLRYDQFERGMVGVKLHEVTFICRNDNVNSVYFSYPVNRLTTSYRIDDPGSDYVFTMTPFGMFEKSTPYDEKHDTNFISFTLTGWMVQGHGYALQWVKLDPAEIARGSRKDQ